MTHGESQVRGKVDNGVYGQGKVSEAEMGVVHELVVGGLLQCRLVGQVIDKSTLVNLERSQCVALLKEVDNSISGHDFCERGSDNHGVTGKVNLARNVVEGSLA